MSRIYTDMTEEAFKYMRCQRHDFMNYLQVIYGYIQLDCKDSAMEYIMKINKNMQLLGKLGNINDRGLYLAISEFIATCYRNDIEVELCCDESYISYEINTKNIKEAVNAFCLCGDEMGSYYEDHETDNPMAYIYLLEDNKGSRTFIASTYRYEQDSTFNLPWKELDDAWKAKVCYTDSGMLLKIELS